MDEFEDLSFIFSGSGAHYDLGGTRPLHAALELPERPPPPPKPRAAESDAAEEAPEQPPEGERPALTLATQYNLARIPGDVIWAAQALADAGLNVTFLPSSVQIEVPPGMSEEDLEHFIQISDLQWAVETLSTGAADQWARGSKNAKPVDKPKQAEIKPPRKWKPRSADSDDEEDEGGGDGGSGGPAWRRSAVELMEEGAGGGEDGWPMASADLLDVLAGYDDELLSAVDLAAL